MKRYSILLTLLICAGFLHAQRVPGYLGSRWSVGYNALVSPALANPTTADEPSFFTDEYGGVNPDYGFGINVQHNLVAEYAISKKHSLAANLLISRNAMNPFYEYDYRDDGVSFKDYPRMAATGLIGEYRIYSDHFSPLGKYFSMRLGYARVGSRDFDYTYTRSNYAPWGDPVSDTTFERSLEGINSGMFILGMGWGVNRIVSDKVMISFGATFNAALGGKVGETEMLPWEDPAKLQVDSEKEINEERLANMARSRFFYESALSFRLGVSYLL